MQRKIFKTLDEQIEIFEAKGLTINDYYETKKILFRENYFFINGYRHLLMKQNGKSQFIEGSTFEELYSIFLFDRKMRNIMFKYILVIENNIKSITSYQLSKKYGYKEKEYLNSKNFRNDTLKNRQVNDVINKMKRQISKNAKQHSATAHYVNNYGYIPLWVSVKVLSFGIISELFTILKEEDRNEIAETYNINSKTLEIYLSILANYRNLCAHEDILYDHTTQRKIPDSKYHSRLNIPKVEDEYIYGKNDLYSVVIILKQMLSEREFTDFINEIGYEIDILEGKLFSVEASKILNRIGFPNNWRDILDI